MLVTIITIIAAILIIAAVMMLTTNFFHVEALNSGIDSSEANLGIIPNSSAIFGAAAPANVDQTRFHSLKKGHDIKLVGAADGEVKDFRATRYAVKPKNFRGIAPIPKLLVQLGDEVKAGEALFYDKSNEDIMFVSPVSGEVVEIQRGAKRAITAVVVLADKEESFKQFSAPSLDADRSELVKFLMGSGFWPFIIKRPFDTIADPNVIPRDIFISLFESAPLATPASVQLAGSMDDFNHGLEVLTKLTDGKVYLGCDAADGSVANEVVENDKIEKHWFKGPHPAGNVGIQIHHIKPINAADQLWTLKMNTVATLGKLFRTGQFDTSNVIGLTGAGFNKNEYIRTPLGADLTSLLEGRSNGKKVRMICGDVLTGAQLKAADFLDANINQLTSLAEGDYHEMFGWLLPLSPRPSVSGTYPNALFKNFKFEPDTNTHGEERAFVVTGQYENLLPMDLYPQHLIKAILANDYERMEGLGIYELSEEDLALCEFACTSKVPAQKILRQGLDMMEEQS